MHNIWEFLLQTLAVSLVAAVLLIIKRLMEDKLSPRWQYAVWLILAARILCPVFVRRTVMLPLPIWIEIIKSHAERMLQSSYAAPYVPLSPTHVLPIPQGIPHSATDWIFVLYTAGVILSALWYLLSYLRLRLLLRHGRTPSAATEEQIARVCTQYGLRACRAVEVEGLPSAFVCGILRPILALPANRTVEDTVLLHELLHLKHHDALQNSFWCALRCLHWCNPLMHLITRRIENDMESLCDGRVLERLHGEERRAYGATLLAMANDRFPRAPGSTSVSNGGKNIARRIAAIVRFKKYPRGMSLVSVCIILVLLTPMLIGARPAVDNTRYLPANHQLEETLAWTRLRRCTSVAGAIDSYAKGLMLENGTYIATAVPLSRQEELAAKMRENVYSFNTAWFLDAGAEFEHVQVNDGYDVYELTGQEDGTYLCYLIFTIKGIDEAELDTPINHSLMYEGQYSLAVPLRVFYADGWCAEEAGERLLLGYSRNDLLYPNEEAIPFGRKFQTETPHGTVTIWCRSLHTVDNERRGTMFHYSYFDTSLRPDAGFYSCETQTLLDYDCIPDAAGQMPQESIGIKCAELESPDEKVNFPRVTLKGSTSGSSSGGYFWGNNLLHPEWDGEVWEGAGTIHYEIDLDAPAYPAAYWVQIFWDDEPVEELRLTEVLP